MIDQVIRIAAIIRQGVHRFDLICKFSDRVRRAGSTGKAIVEIFHIVFQMVWCVAFRVNRDQ